MKATNPKTGLLCALFVLFAAQTRAANTFQSAGDWTDGALWSEGREPTAGEDVIIDADCALAGSPVGVGAVTVNAGDTLTFSGWDTVLTATVVTVEGTVTHEVNTDTVGTPGVYGDWTPDNRVALVADTLFVATNGAITAKEKGYKGGLGNATGYGPGAGLKSKGGGYGGIGGSGTAANGGTYGDYTAPTDPGSGGGGGNGTTRNAGGAIWIRATNVVVNGTVSVEGGQASSAYEGGSSGGSIYIQCRTFAGTNGLVTANGGESGYLRTTVTAGGGGRIAVIYDTTAQAALGAPAVTFSAAGGVSDQGVYGDIGTLYFPDNQFLLDPRFATETITHSGQWMVPGLASYAATNLTLDSAWIRISTNGFVLNVTNNILIDGTDTGLHILDLHSPRVTCGGDVVLSNATFYLRPGDTNSPHLVCGRLALDGARMALNGTFSRASVNATTSDCPTVNCDEVDLANASELYVYSAETNGAARAYGAWVDVTNAVTITGASWVYPFSHGTDGGSALFRMHSLLIPASGAGIDASQRGYYGGPAGSPGYGPGRGDAKHGGGHGGVSGYAAAGYGGTYGSITAPADPGSGGGGGNGTGLYGGGLIRIEATNVVVNGSLLANGQSGGVYEGAGAGGGVYIRCATFAGTNGVVQANGGNSTYNSSNPSGGGGGRIAVIYNTLAQDAVPLSGVAFSAAGGSSVQNPNGDIGTLYFPDNRFLFDPRGTDTITHRGEWRVDGVTSIAATNLVFSNAWIRMPYSGFRIDLTNDLTATGSDPKLYEITLLDAVVTCGGDIALSDAAIKLTRSGTVSPSLSIGRDLTLEGGALTVYSGITNAASPDHGALVTIGRDITMTNTATMWLYSHPTNGGSVLIRASNITMHADATIDADGKGFSGRPGASVPGRGPGAGAYNLSGAGYGGLGGHAVAPYGQTYGDSNAPVHPGSSGGGRNSAAGGAGGGLIRMEITNTATLHGTLTANGTSFNFAGSGGAIYIKARVFDAAYGAMSANGGNGATYQGGSAGGGGRIALMDWESGNFDALATAGGGTVGDYLGQTGTIVRVMDQTLKTLTVQGLPDRHGVSSPHDYGDNGVNQGVEVTVAVSQYADEAAGMRYICHAWAWTNVLGSTDSGSGTQVTFTVADNSTLSWLWTNQYYLAATAATNGSLLVERTGWYTNGVQVQVTPVPDSGYQFVQWSGSGVPPGESAADPLTVTMDQAREIAANFTSTQATTRVWSGIGTWLTPTNWTPQGLPGPADTVFIGSGQCTIQDAASVASVTVSNGATLVFENWNTRLSATDITIEGAVTHLTNPDSSSDGGWDLDNRVYLQCSNFVITTTGSIDVDYKGYRGGPANTAGYGPGAGAAGKGGGYGGEGGGASGGYGQSYGATVAPEAPGSGGGGGNSTGGYGGGAVRIMATNVVLNGDITANGEPEGVYRGGGSGGGIYITCRTITGANSSLEARGGIQNYNHQNPSGGGGGRISVVYDATAQAALPVPTIAFSTLGGSSVQQPCGEVGSLYFPDNRFLLDPRFGTEVITHHGQWYVPGFTAWSPDSLMLSNAWIRFMEPGFALDVANDMVVLGTDQRLHKLELLDAGVSCGGDVSLTDGSLLLRRSDGAPSMLTCSGAITLDDSVLALNGDGSSSALGGLTNVAAQLTCGDDLTLRDGSAFYVYACATNGNVWGAEVQVGGTLTVETNTWIYPFSHSTNGGSVYFKARQVTIEGGSGGGIYAVGQGFGGGVPGSSLPAYGPGGALPNYGGGYGGLGGGASGAYGQTYGDSNAPVFPGSGGGRGNGYGMSGGGLVRLDVAGTVTLGGLITVHGTSGGVYEGGGSGGGIYITCHKFVADGNAALNAGGGNGGYLSNASGGGGGRIAVWRVKDLSSAQTATDVTAGTGAKYNGAVGTVVWGQLPSSGTVIIFR